MFFSLLAKLLLDNGVDANAMESTRYNKTPIQSAVVGGNLKMVKLLIEHGVKINSKSQFELPPLQIAVYNKNYEIVEFLLERGANVNQRFNDCEKDTSTTALHIACMEGHNNIAEILMNYGADVNALHGKNIFEIYKYYISLIFPLMMALHIK